MLSESALKRISKFLSLVLRHDPASIGITLDAAGWTNVDELIRRAAASGLVFDLVALKQVVETNDKKRFAFDETFSRIRANQGHSVEVELGYNPQEPPPLLFHGTGAQSVASILKNGLQKRERHHVHLSPDTETAVKVGRRHGRPVVLHVLAKQMHDDGFAFYLSANGVWLTDHVPAKYLKQDK